MRYIVATFWTWLDTSSSSSPYILYLSIKLTYSKSILVLCKDLDPIGRVIKKANCTDLCTYCCIVSVILQFYT